MKKAIELSVNERLGLARTTEYSLSGWVSALVRKTGASSHSSCSPL